MTFKIKRYEMSPETGRKIHIAMMIFWFFNLIVANGLMIYYHTNPAIMYLTNISIYANLVGHWSGWSAERPTEVVESDKSGTS